MNSLFVDTSAWFAVLVSSDPNHERAKSWLSANRRDLLVTDYIVDELLTALRSRHENRRALEIGARFFSGKTARTEWVTRSDVQAAWDVFREFQDKDWSFTDCVSQVVMLRLGIDQAFAFDDHFRQFGTVAVVP